MHIKLIISTAAVLCALRGTVLSQQVPATNAPKISCDMAIFDFGERDEVSPVTHAFTIRNGGNADLLIRGVRTSCGCTAASPSTNRLAPGDQATIAATFNLQGKRGLQSKAISIESNDPAQPVFHLYLNGTAVTELTLDPAFVTFGNVAISSNVSREVQLLARKPGINVTNLVCDSSYFQAALKEPQPGKPPTILISTVPPLPSGQTRGTLHVYTDHPERKELQVSLMVMVLPEVRVLPNEITVRGPPGGPAQRVALLLIPGTLREYQILSVEVPFPETKAQFRMTAPGSYRLDITNLPAGPEINGKKILIRTTLNAMREIAVPLTFIQESPQR